MAVPDSFSLRLNPYDTELLTFFSGFDENEKLEVLIKFEPYTDEFFI